jgi:hypothetical protein
VTITEANSGTRSATFVLTLSAPSGRAITVGYATADDTAAAPSDFTAASGTVTFSAGATTGRSQFRPSARRCPSRMRPSREPRQPGQRHHR